LRKDLGKTEEVEEDLELVAVAGARFARLEMDAIRRYKKVMFFFGLIGG